MTLLMSLATLDTQAEPEWFPLPSSVPPGIPGGARTRFRRQIQDPTVFESTLSAAYPGATSPVSWRNELRPPSSHQRPAAWFLRAMVELMLFRMVSVALLILANGFVAAEFALVSVRETRSIERLIALGGPEPGQYARLQENIGKTCRWACNWA